MAVDKRSNQQQIIQGVLDEENQALKVIVDGITVDFDGGTIEADIDAATGDNIAIADASTGVKAGVTATGRLKVETTGDSTITGTVSIPPSTDFQVKTLDVTIVATQLTFEDLATVSSISIKALSTNAGDVKVGKSDVATNYYLLSPGEALNLPVYGGAEVYLIRDAGAGTFGVTTTAVN